MKTASNNTDNSNNKLCSSLRRMRSLRKERCIHGFVDSAAGTGSYSIAALFPPQQKNGADFSKTGVKCSHYIGICGLICSHPILLGVAKR